MTTTPEAILARFAAEYAEHGRGPERRLTITYDDETTQSGYITQNPLNFFIRPTTLATPYYTYLPNITRIDYSNARYRGAQPLWERDPS